MFAKRLILVALFVCLTFSPASAQAPATIGYQGILTDANGVAVPNGAQTITFRLYAAASGGSALWTETQTVTTTSGAFSAVLGSGTALNISFNQPLHLGITVGSGSELTPRIALTASPYSLTAKTVEDGAVSSSKLSDNAVTTVKIQDGSVSSAKIAGGAVTSTQLADNAVTGAKVASGQVVKGVNSLTDAVTLAAGSNVTITPSGNTLTIAATGAALADNAVTTAKISDGAVTTAKIATGGVTTTQVADGTIATVDLADNAVTGAKVASGQVVKSVNSLTDAVTLTAGSNVTITPSGSTLTIAATGTSLPDDAVTTVKISDGAVTTAKIATGGVTTTQVADGTIATVDLTDNAVTGAKVASGQVVKSVNTLKDDVTLAAGSNVTITPSGNTLTIAATGTSLPDDAVTTAKIADGAVTSTKIAGSAVTTAQLADGTVATADIADNAVTGAKVADGTVATADLADNAVTSAKIVDGTVATADLADNSVTTAKIVDGTIAAGDIADGTLTGLKISGGQVVKSVNALTDAVTLAAGSNVTITPSGNTLTIAATGAALADNAVTTAKIADGAVTTVKIATGGVTTTQIADGTIATADLANNAVTTAQVADGTIATADLADNAVTSAKVVDGTVATADLADNSVTTAKIVDGTIAAGDIADGTLTGLKISGGQVVKSVNTLKDDVTLAAGSNITITPSGNTLTIAAAASGTGNTLDQAYDQGGAGAGRTITADAGAVNIAGAGGLTVNGNVGIGTTSPGQLLHLSSGSTLGTGIRVDNTDTGGRNFRLLSTGSGNTGGAGKFHIYDETGGAFRLTADASGNVGVGTTSPGYLLEARKDQNDVTRLVVNNGTAGTAAAAQVLAMREGGNGIGMTAYSGSFTPSGIYLPNRGMLRTDSGLTNGLVLATGGASAPIILAPVDTERLRIDASGNVGIGTTSPGAKLHVSGTNIGMLLDNAGDLLWKDSGGTTRGVMSLHSDDNVYLDAPVSGKDLIFRTESSGTQERMRILSSGNVGIGTTSPAYKLDVAGVGRFTGGAVNIVGSSGNAELSIIPETASPNGTISTETTGGALRFRTRNSGGAVDERMRISSEGNVGIGTTSPANLLTVQQTSATDPIADAWTVYSSRRWKTNIQTLKDPMGKVRRLRGVSYQWKADGKQDVGLIAEEVGEVIPEVVAYEENGKDAKSVDYARLVAVLIEAVKAQQKEIEALKAKVEGMERAMPAHP